MAFGLFLGLAALCALGCAITSGRLTDALAALRSRGEAPSASFDLGSMGFVWTASHRALGDADVTRMVLATRTLLVAGGLALAMAYVCAEPAVAPLPQASQPGTAANSSPDA